MIGKIIQGRSFSGCIRYCLEDKLSQSDEVVCKERAELLYTNMCCGKKEELIGQFASVRALNPRLQKPVLHLVLSMAQGERLSKENMVVLVSDLARVMGFADRQYLAVSHRDTEQQHLHVVVNRVGFDGRTLQDSNNYHTIASFCRQAELKFSLKQVLSPKRFLALEQRKLPRLDQRKEALSKEIKAVLDRCRSLPQFRQGMEEKGYRVLMGRGIAFVDPKGVKVKGSEVGYSFLKIGQLLAHREPQHLAQRESNLVERQHLQAGNKGQEVHPAPMQVAPAAKVDSAVKQASEELLRPQEQQAAPNPAFTRKKKQARKLRRHL